MCTAARRIRRRRKGLTLIELVMVLVILAALAAMIVPIVDSLRRTSDKTTGSAVIKQVVDNVSLFRTITGKYPGQLDSLVEVSGGNAAAYSKLPADLTGKLTMKVLTSSELDGLAKIGISPVMDHDTNLANVYRGQPGNSGTIARTFSSSATAATASFMVVNNVAGKGLDIFQSIYPGAAVDTDGYTTLSNGDKVRLVVLGVGPNTTAVGKTLVAAPAYSAVDGLAEYNRFLAIYAVYTGPAKTKRAQLKGALDTTGDFLNQELNEVTENNLE